MASQMEKRKAARQGVDNVLEQINSLEILISEYDGNIDALQGKLESYVASLKALHAAGSALERNGRPFEVPVELLRFVDDGGNPDNFIIDTVRSAAAANERAKGKIDAFRALRKGLSEDSAAAFPEIMGSYTKLRQSRGDGGGGGGNDALAVR